MIFKHGIFVNKNIYCFLKSIMYAVLITLFGLPEIWVLWLLWLPAKC